MQQKKSQSRRKNSSRAQRSREKASADELPVDHPDRKRLPPLLRMAWFGLTQKFRRRIAHLDVTPDQFTILRWVIECGSERPTQRQLCDLMASDVNTIAALLKRMENAKLVERHRDEHDRRANRIHATAAGRRAFAKARRVASELQEEILSALPEPDRDGFLEQLEIVAFTCREHEAAGK